MKKLSVAGMLLAASLWGITIHPPTERTMRSITVTWEPSSDSSFGSYVLYRYISDSLSGTQIANITDITDTTFTDTLLHIGSKYYYRLFVLNTADSVIDSSSFVHAWTLPNTYPFSNAVTPDDYHFREAPDCSWGVVTDQYHSAPYSFNDSPGQHFAPNSDNSLYLLVDLQGAHMPVLSFWERHQMDNHRNGDHAYVQVSTDYGLTWQTLYSIQGYSEWHNVKIDLSQLRGAVVLIRFRMKANSDATTGDGWWIDDISINETDVASPSTPFYDNVEDSSIRAYWISSSWLPTQTGLNGSKAWDARPYSELDFGGDYNLTMGNVIDFSTLAHPQIQFYMKKSLYGYLYVEASEDSGHTWQRERTFDLNTRYSEYVRFQVDLSSYAGTEARLRFRFHGYGDTWLNLDDILIKDAPNDVSLNNATNITSNSATITWSRYNGSDFKAYEVRRAEWDGVTWGSQLIARITSPDDTVFVDSSLNANVNYHYRVFVVDTTDMKSVGSNEISFTTPWVTTFQSYPYSEDFESGFPTGWVADSGWGLVYGVSHSGNASITESPYGNYPSSSDRSIYFGIDLSSAVMPVLTFYERTDFGNEYDQGIVEIRGAGQTWYRLYTEYRSHGWQKVAIDLSPYAGLSQVYIRFRFTSDSNDTTGNGWFIDDVSVGETNIPEVSYPFYDDVEDTSTTNKWIKSSWHVETYNGRRFYKLIVMDTVGNEPDEDFYSLTLGRDMDLSSSVHPSVSFDIKGYANYTYLQFSVDSGKTWQTVWNGSRYYGDFTHVIADLPTGGGHSVRIRFMETRLWGGHHYPIYLDNIRIGEDYRSYPVADTVRLLRPDTIVISTAMPTPEIYGIVFERYVTDSTGEESNVLGQVGYGPYGTDPSDSSWIWSNASFVKDTLSGFDLYRGVISPNQAGIYNFTMRFSIDTGNTWIYADLNGNDLGGGGTNGYSARTAGYLNVTLPPQMAISEDTIRISVLAGDSVSHYAEISNTGTGVLYANFDESEDGSTASDVPWFSVTSPRIMVSPGGHASICLSVRSDTLSVGTHTAYLVVNSNDPDANPLFVPIELTVMDSTANVLQGILVDQQGNPINMVGTIQVYSGNSLVEEVSTDGIGQFTIPGITDTVDIRYFADGFYPAWKYGVTASGTRLYLQLSPVPSPIPTNEKVDFYGDTVRFNNEPLKKGDVITAYDPDGVLCGVYYVRNEGEYGFMHVYGDDPTTDEDEGASPGDTLLFLINEYSASNFRPNAPVWTMNNATVKLNFDAGNVDTVVLRSGWNLISFTVMPEDTQIQSILAPILSNTVIVTSFDQSWGGARTFDPALPGYSDLQTMDPEHGYWIKLTSPDTLVVTGRRFHSSSPIGLKAGWNLVSYLPEPTESVDVALSSIVGNIYVVDGFDSVAMTYRPGSPYNDLYVMKNGLGYWIKTYFADSLYYEGFEGSKVLGENGDFALMGGPKDGVMPTPYWTDYFGTAFLNGAAVHVGDTITAYDPDGVLCGEFVVRTEGEYGFMHVYGDDPTTPNVDEGAVAGDSVRFYINGHYVATATDSLAWTGSRDAFEFPLGTTGVHEGHGTVKVFRFAPISPNPVIGSMNISFSLPAKMKVKVALYDVSGKMVKTIAASEFEAGRHSLRVPLDALHAGMYFVRLEAGKFTKTRKVIVLR